MPKIDITVSEDLKQLLEELSLDSGQTLSSLAADCLKVGAYAEVESRNKVEVYRKTRKQRMERELQEKSQENK
ncbi:hypothetical protein [Nostoc sp. ChiQUE01b]|uniref:hypothetical protein n=1 Tax=Nostoc sp. ChiQUE01b TaxID=3075376 RepID=UPI002AD2101E|nr:hypothetical protein [Nostoc sp. ChiQUE01b]MDZ8259871.1 hypothetical protein [Nostoc sp. ChiQUE01b]